jgi:hypothetical protein
MFKSPLFFEFILQWWSIIVAFIIKRYNYNSEYLIVNRPFPFWVKFWLDKNFITSFKEHHKISNIPKFRCEML